MDTDRLIHQLAAKVPPVRRLPAPGRRTAMWLAISLPYVAALTLAHSLSVPVDLSAMLTEWQFIIEQIATMLTAIAAATAAFYSTVPGFDRRVLLLPLPPLAVWLLSLGAGCIADWIRSGPDGLSLQADWDCLPPAVLLGSVPVVTIVMMLRRGAPLHPRITLAFAALAAAALGNFGLRIFHVGDASILLLVWHFGAVVLLSLMAAWIGRRVLSWKSVQLAAPE